MTNISQITIRKVSNGFIAEITRIPRGVSPGPQRVEKVFTSLDQVADFIKDSKDSWIS